MNVASGHQILSGQVALVVGAGGGIGGAVALALARAGAGVALMGRSRPSLASMNHEIEAVGGSALVCQADATDEESVRASVNLIIRAHRRIDVVVNCAGLNVRDRALGVVSTAEWRRILDANITGAFIVSRAVLPTMRQQRSGTIVHVSSTAGVGATLLSGPAYSASKAALNSLTESINLAEREHGIRATLICPGDVSTPLLDLWPSPPTVEERRAMLQPVDVADLVVAAVGLPARATLELAVMRPTRDRGRI